MYLKKAGSKSIFPVAFVMSAYSGYAYSSSPDWVYAIADCKNTFPIAVLGVCITIFLLFKKSFRESAFLKMYCAVWIVASLPLFSVGYPYYLWTVEHAPDQNQYEAYLGVLVYISFALSLILLPGFVQYRLLK